MKHFLFSFGMNNEKEHRLCHQTPEQNDKLEPIPANPFEDSKERPDRWSECCNKAESVIKKVGPNVPPRPELEDTIVKEVEKAKGLYVPYTPGDNRRVGTIRTRFHNVRREMYMEQKQYDGTWQEIPWDYSLFDERPTPTRAPRRPKQKKLRNAQRWNYPIAQKPPTAPGTLYGSNRGKINKYRGGVMRSRDMDVSGVNKRKKLHDIDTNFRKNDALKNTQFEDGRKFLATLERTFPNTKFRIEKDGRIKVQAYNQSFDVYPTQEVGSGRFYEIAFRSKKTGKVEAIRCETPNAVITTIQKGINFGNESPPITKADIPNIASKRAPRISPSIKKLHPKESNNSSKTQLTNKKWEKFGEEFHDFKNKFDEFAEHPSKGGALKVIEILNNKLKTESLKKKDLDMTLAVLNYPIPENELYSIAFDGAKFSVKEEKLE